MSIRFDSKQCYIVQKINLFTPNPKGSNLIFFTPFRDGVNEENQDHILGIKADNHIALIVTSHLFNNSFYHSNQFYRFNHLHALAQREDG